MRSTVTDLLAPARAHLTERRYPEALAELRRIDPSALIGEAFAEYCLLVTEAGLHVGDYSDDRIDEAIEGFRFSSETAQFAKAKFLKGWRLISLGRHGEAKEVLLEAYTNYLRCQDDAGAARALNRLSLAYFQTGDLDRAVDYLRRCIELHRSRQDGGRAAIRTVNLASIEGVAGRIAESLRCYASIEKAIRDEGEKNLLIFHLMSCMPHAMRGDFETARNIIARAEPYLDKYIREKAIYYENLGYIELHAGEHKAAEAALKAGLEISMNLAPESALVSQIKRLFGDLYLEMRRPDLSRRFTLEALQVAEKIGERIEIAACRRILARLEQLEGRADQGRRWFREATDTFNIIGCLYELAVTRYLAAVSGLYDNGERTALLYLAREYFVSEDVTCYAERIDAALKAAPASQSQARAKTGVGPVFVAVSPAMQKLAELAQNIADSEMTVLLTGETGTGKDQMAQYIHWCSSRPGEFVPVNAAAIPDGMIEAELFGHSRGAYTGADRARAGLFEAAQGGTIYLNEIGDATPALQAKLLEVLESRKVRRLGENDGREINFRIIAATNHNLQKDIDDGRFRLDLFQRLKEIPVALPPLAERPEDIEPLVAHFMSELGVDSGDNGGRGEISRLAMILTGLPWPGNVRELRSCVNQLWIQSGRDLKRMIDRLLDTEGHDHGRMLAGVLKQTRWNRSETARIFGVSEGTVRNWIARYEISE